MRYFILLPGDSPDAVDFESNLLGEDSFATFWAGDGLKVLMKLVDQQPELLPQVTIKTDKNETLTIEEFLTRIQKLKIRIN
jgi:hypothetical protein